MQVLMEMLNVTLDFLSGIPGSLCLQVCFAACRPASAAQRAPRAKAERRVGNLLCFFSCSEKRQWIHLRFL